ncbi:hypothetical protein Hanom_Chr04g00340431 [Helianthus anomalus]
MSNKFIRIWLCFRLCSRLIMLLIMFSIAFCYVLAMSALTRYLYRCASVSSQSRFGFRFGFLRLVCVRRYLYSVYD